MSCSNIVGRKNICDHLFWHTDYGYRNMFWQNVVFRNCDVSNKTPCNPASSSHSNSCSDRKPTNESRMFSSEEREVNGPCRLWNNNGCSYGTSCKFLHVDICRYQGSCRYGKSVANTLTSKVFNKRALF